MLQLKSFKFSDGEEASKFLRENILHGKDNVLVSNGEMVIPYEDGIPPSTMQLILSAKEDRQTFVDQMIPIVHSQRVMEVDVIGINKKIEEEKAKFLTISGKKEAKESDKVARDNNAKIQKEIARLENVKTQKESQRIMNQAEITRIVTNIAVYDETIASLEGSTKGDGEQTGTKK